MPMCAVGIYMRASPLLICDWRTAQELKILLSEQPFRLFVAGRQQTLIVRVWLAPCK